jgi:Tol biopolymer transport system component
MSTDSHRRIAAFVLAISSAVAGNQRGNCAETNSSDAAGTNGSEDYGVASAVIEPRGTTKTIDFDTEEGTLISTDVSSADRSIVFDLMGQIYLIGPRGGEAKLLTRDSGLALNYQPRFSPDGKTIAFISDRSGQGNVWTMDVDGSHPRPALLDFRHQYSQPAWGSEGHSIFAVRAATTPGSSWTRRNSSIWRIELSGGAAQAILAGTLEQFYSPCPSRDARTLFYQRASMAGRGIAFQQVGLRIEAMDLASRGTRRVAGDAEDDAPSVDGDYWKPRDNTGATFAPALSHSNKFLAFAKSVRRPIEIRGRRFEMSTALFIRDLQRNTEKEIFWPLNNDLAGVNTYFTDEALPLFSWDSDDESIVVGAGGKIVRIDVATGVAVNVPFRVHVHRDISEQTRSRFQLGPDESVATKFIRWPSASPDGRRIVFAAAGRLWIKLDNRSPTPLTPLAPDSTQFTPSFSPDGRSIAFATWSTKIGGALWTMRRDGSALHKISSGSDAYIYPTWKKRGHELAALRRQTPTHASEFSQAWDPHSGWELVMISAAGRMRSVAPVGQLSPISMDAEGRVYFQHQNDPIAARELEAPYPGSNSLAQRWTVSRIEREGRISGGYACFPARAWPGARPVVSPNGDWIAYTADFRIYVMPLHLRAAGGEEPCVNPDPNQSNGDRIRADEWGGVDVHWRDADTIEFASGSDYLTFNAKTRSRSTTAIRLWTRRDFARGSVLLKNARIIPIDSDRVIERGSVLVRDGKIACVGQCQSGGAVTVIDLAGKTVIPGLIDVHSHTTREDAEIMPTVRARSALPLAYGVTTIVDPASPATDAFVLAAATDAGYVRGPRVFTTSDPVFSSDTEDPGVRSTSWGDLLDIKSPEDAEYEVGRRVKWGAISIKNFRLPSRQQQQLLMDAARRFHVTVTAEGGSLLRDLGMTMDGQTGWEHFLPPMPLYRDATQFFGQAGVTYSPTLMVAGAPEGSMYYWRERSHLATDDKYTRFASADELAASEAYITRGTVQPLSDFAFPILALGVADMLHAGGHATIGEHGEQPGIGSHWELWTYATSLTPTEVLRMATLDGARFVGLENDLGSVTIGKRADLVILAGNPLDDIRQTANIVYVMKAGRLYDGETLNQVWPKADHFGPLPWVKKPAHAT